MSFGEGIKAKQKRDLPDIGKPGEIAVVGARGGARRIVAIVFRVRRRRGGIGVRIGMRLGLRRRTGAGRRWRTIGPAHAGLLHRFAAIRRAVAVSGIAVARRRRDGADEVEILTALHQHTATGFNQHPAFRIGKAHHFHRALENHHLCGALGIHLDAEFSAADGDGGGGAVHPVRIRLAGEVVDLDPHHTQRDAEELAQRGRRPVILERHDGFGRDHHHAAVAEIDHHAPAAARIDAIARVQDIAGGQHQRRQAGRQQDCLPGHSGGTGHYRRGLGVRSEGAE